MALQKGNNSFVTITEAEGYFYDRYKDQENKKLLD